MQPINQIHKDLLQMRKKTLWLLLALLILSGTMLTSCVKEDNTGEPIVEPEQSLPAARITKTIRKDEAKATVFNIEYPSVDAFGKPCTLSGVIIVGDEVDTDNKQARGMVLYNHFTVFRKDQCPSLGDLGIPLKVVGSKLICVAPDYYGFGVTGDKDQGYCIPSANAQGSIDCLLAARTLLKEKGYSWGDFLFNLGYSEGGQTAMGVIRLCAEKYKDIKITHSVCGAGPYDIGETYRQLVSSGETTMPSTVISTLLSYNEFFKLGVHNTELFQEPTLSNIPVYLLSKDYSRGELEGKLAPNKIADWIQPILLDFKSDLSLKFMDVFEKENQSKGWKPLGTERINLVHNTLDGCVPYANTPQMIEFFKQNGFKFTEYSKGEKCPYTDGNIYLTAVTLPALSDKMDTHETGAIPFITDLIQVICHYLQIAPWFTFSPGELGGV